MKNIDKKGCCFACLKIGQIVRQCKRRISCERCKAKHSILLCKEDKQKEHNKSKIGATEGNSDQIAIHDTTLGNQICWQEILLQTLYVRLRSKNGGEVIRCLIDTGSQRTYLSKKVAEEMNYERINEENVAHSLLGAKEHVERHFRYTNAH